MSVNNNITVAATTTTNVTIKQEPDDIECNQKIQLDKQYLNNHNKTKSSNNNNQQPGHCLPNGSIKTDDESIEQKPTVGPGTTTTQTQFPLFTRHTVQAIAEQCNLTMDLTQSAADLIAEDLSYRIRELIHCSSQFMRHSFRTKLKTKDITKAMQELDCDIIFGHNNAQDNWNNNNHYQYVSQANVFVEDCKLVDLKAESSQIIRNRFESRNNSDNRVVYKQDRPYLFRVNWFQSKNSICDNFNQSSVKYFNLISNLLLNIGSSKLCHIPTSERHKLLQIIFRDLSTNDNIRSILYCLVDFVLKSLRTWNQFTLTSDVIDLVAFNQSKIETYSNFLSTISAAIRNKHFTDLSLKTQIIEELTEILFSICFNSTLIPSSSLELFYHSMKLRSQIAHLFCQIIFKFCLPFTNLQCRLIALLREKITYFVNNQSTIDFLNKAAIDYTILILHRYLGFDICLRNLQPLISETSYFDVYFGDVNRDLNRSSDDYWCRATVLTLIRGEICLIGELVMKGLALLVSQISDDFVFVDQSDQIYAYYFKHFGDSLSLRLTSLFETPLVQNRRKSWVDNWRSNVAIRSTKLRSTDNNDTKTTPVLKSETTTNFDRSPTKLADSFSNLRKKKGSCKVLESMLSTDTTNMAKNESLSMFTESLLEASHRQYSQKLPMKTFLYQEDYDNFSVSFLSNTTNTPTFNHSIWFEGKRLPKATQAEEYSVVDGNTNGTNKNLNSSSSSWHKLNLNYQRGRKKNSFLPGFYGFPRLYDSFSEMEDLDDEHNINQPSYDSRSSSNNCLSPPTPPPLTSKSVSRRRFHPVRHQAFHYHRINQHLRTNYSLYTTLL